MKAKIGEIVLLLGITLFIIGGIGVIVGFLPQDKISLTGALALMFIITGANMKRRGRKQRNSIQNSYMGEGIEKRLR